MKTLLTTLFLALSFAASAQDDKWSVLSFRTSSVCDMCETTIEKELIYEKGVKSVDLDLSTNLVKVEYDERKTTPEAIKVALTKLGYHADELPGDSKAFANLPACCQKEGCGKMPEKKE
jgi:copper chaperone CopZ